MPSPGPGCPAPSPVGFRQIADAPGGIFEIVAIGEQRVPRGAALGEPTWRDSGRSWPHRSG